MLSAMSSSELSCVGGPDTDRVPLVALLGRAETAFIAEFERRIRDSEFSALSLAHSRNVLRHLAAGPLRAAHIVERCEVSKQAISQQIVHLEANGYVRVAADPGDQRARVISLTERGVRAQRLVGRLFEEIEQDWATALGEQDSETLRRVLTTALDVVPRGACGTVAQTTC